MPSSRKRGGSPVVTGWERIGSPSRDHRARTSQITLRGGGHVNARHDHRTRRRRSRRTACRGLRQPLRSAPLFRRLPRTIATGGSRSRPTWGASHRCSRSNPTGAACGRSPMFRAKIRVPRTRSGRLTAPRSPSTPQPARASTSSPCHRGRVPAAAAGVGAFNGDPAYSADGTQISFDQDAGPSAPRYTASSSRTPTAPTRDESPPGSGPPRPSTPNLNGRPTASDSSS